MVETKKIQIAIQALCQRAADHLAAQKSGKIFHDAQTGAVDKGSTRVAVLAIEPTNTQALRSAAQQILAAAKDESDVYNLALQFGLIREASFADGKISA